MSLPPPLAADGPTLRAVARDASALEEIGVRSHVKGRKPLEIGRHEKGATKPLFFGCTRQLCANRGADCELDFRPELARVDAALQRAGMNTTSVLVCPIKSRDEDDQ